MEPIKPIDGSSHTVTPLQEKQWARLVREEDDRYAFEKLFRVYYEPLFGYAYTFVKCRENAEDIVQNIFLRIWSNRKSWNPPGKVKHYLFVAVRNEALNEIRHEQIESESEDYLIELFKDLISQTYNEQSQEVDRLREVIQREIDRLPSPCKEIYLLNRNSGLTYTEIADFLDISINSVGKLMGRALKILRKNLSDFAPIFIVSVISKLMF